jgi:cytochrome c5
MDRAPVVVRSVARNTVVLLTLLVSACGGESPLLAPTDFAARDAGKDAGAKRPRDAGASDVEDGEDDDDAESDDDTGATAAPSTDAGPAPKDAGTRSDASAPAVDMNDCATLTYESFGKAFVGKFCIACHSGTMASSALGGVSLDSLPNIVKNKMYLKKVTAPRTDGIESRMPKGGNPDLTNQGRAKFGAWIDCGPN